MYMDELDNLPLLKRQQADKPLPIAVDVDACSFSSALEDGNALSTQRVNESSRQTVDVMKGGSLGKIYCVKCRTRTGNGVTRIEKTKNNKNCLKSKCNDCGTTKCRFTFKTADKPNKSLF